MHRNAPPLFNATVTSVVAQARIEPLTLSTFWSPTWWDRFSEHWHVTMPAATDMATFSHSDDHVAVYRDACVSYPPDYASVSPAFATALSVLRPRAREVCVPCHRCSDVCVLDCNSTGPYLPIVSGLPPPGSRSH